MDMESILKSYAEYSELPCSYGNWEVPRRRLAAAAEGATANEGKGALLQ